MMLSFPVPLEELAASVRRDHPGWWRTAECGGSPADAEDLVALTMAAALLADRGSGAAMAVHRLCRERGESGRREELLAILADVPRLRDVVSRASSPGQALMAYLVADSVIDGSRPGGRVFLEDLAEALLMPPVLIRRLRQRSCPPVAAQAGLG